MNGPDDGYAYSPVELEAIMDISVKVIDILDGRARRQEYFDAIDDVKSRDLLHGATYWDLNDSVLEREGDRTQQDETEQRADTFISTLRGEKRVFKRRSGFPLTGRGGIA